MERLVEIGAAGAERPGLGQDLDAGLRKLSAHHARDGAADDPRDDGEDQIQGADVLVIGRHEPAGEEARLMVRVMMSLVGFMGLQRKRVGGNGAHISLVSAWN